MLHVFTLVKLAFPNRETGLLFSLGLSELDGFSEIRVFKGRSERSERGQEKEGFESEVEHFTLKLFNSEGNQGRNLLSGLWMGD